jgi:lauroyl/myristoyl acyltransferase
VSDGQRPDSTGPIAPSDLVVAATLPLLAIVARVLPESRWRPVVSFLASWKPLLGETQRSQLDRIARGLGLETEAARRVLDGFRLAHLEERLQVLKERSSSGWHPSIEVEGEEHLRDARAPGRGAVLWVVNAAIAGLVVKKALHARGYSVHHLSRPSHGLSSTRFGIRWLNPMRTRVEERYVAERVVITEASTVAAMRRLRDALERGETVSITAGDWARRTHWAPFLDGRVRLATGPAALAASTGATLLPVSMTRDQHRFTVTIEEALPLAGEAGVPAAIEAYARRLEAWVRVHPELWNGWSSYEPGA